MYNVYSKSGVSAMSIRMQIYLTEELYEQLKQKSSQSGQPMAEHIRESLGKYLAEPDEEVLAPADPIWSISGKAKNKVGDLSNNHDHYLYETEDGDQS